MFESTTISTANLLYIGKYKDLSLQKHYTSFSSLWCSRKLLSYWSKSFSIILYLLWKKALERQELPKECNFFLYNLLLNLIWIPQFRQSIKMQSRNLTAEIWWLWYIPLAKEWSLTPKWDNFMILLLLKTQSMLYQRK